MTKPGLKGPLSLALVFQLSVLVTELPHLLLSSGKVQSSSRHRFGCTAGPGAGIAPHCMV